MSRGLGDVYKRQKDGKQKELAEIDLRTKEEMNKLEQDKSKLKAAQGGIITADQTKDFQERQSNIQQKNADDRAAIELKYAQELDKIYKQITDDTLSEEDRRIKGIKDKYEEFRKWVEDALKAGNITKEQATDLGIKIDQAEIAAATIRIPTRRSPNCPKKTAKTLFFFPSASTFSPYCASRFAASSVVSPCSEVSIFFFTSSAEI